MKNKEFIRDNGKFRDCVTNVAKASVIELMMERPDVYGYGGMIKSIWDLRKDVVDSFVTIFGLILNIVLLPISPIISIYVSILQAKKQMKRVEILRKSFEK